MVLQVTDASPVGYVYFSAMSRRSMDGEISQLKASPQSDQLQPKTL